jgi:trk system potassium uptake protein
MILLVSEHPGGPHEQGRTLVFEIIFEAFSAMGTVGLSIGLSRLLSVVGKWCIIFLMFIGRIGPLTIALAVSSQKPHKLRFVEEDFVVG